MLDYMDQAGAGLFTLQPPPLPCYRKAYSKNGVAEAVGPLPLTEKPFLDIQFEKT